MYEFELKNIINVPDNFKKGFLSFLQTEENAKLKDNEFENAFLYITQHLESAVGFWNEDEVLTALLKWRVSTIPVTPTPPPTSPSVPLPKPPAVNNRRKKKALEKINNITKIREAKDILNRIVDLDYESILDIILDD